MTHFSVGLSLSGTVAKKGLRILLVDDEPLVRQGLERCLRAYEVFATANYDQALQVLREEPVDVIITDCNMPGPSGVEVLRAALKIQPSTIRFMLSAEPPPELVKLIEAGVVHRFFEKPWSRPMLQIISSIASGSSKSA